MPLREDILAPIPGDNPAGQDLRYAPVYDKLKEARREDDELNQGAWQHERKVADHALVIKLAQESLAKQSKDLQIAVWLAEALLRKNGYAGFAEGLDLCRELIERFWDHLYPELDDGDAEFRVAPLEWISLKFDLLFKQRPLTDDGYDFFKYKESRTVPTEEQSSAKDQKAARDAALKAGKLAPEVFDKAFAATPKAFYAQTEKQIDQCLKSLADLDEVAQARFGEVSPSFTKLKQGMEEVRVVVHQLLQKKRETEPDPVEEAPPAEQEQAPGEAQAEGAEGESGAVGVGGGAAAAPAMYAIQAPEEPADRKQLIEGIVAAAAAMRRREPKSPAPYLMLRGLRFGELRGLVQAREYAKLEAPPTDVRRLVKKLSTDGKWKDLIETAENLMGLPCSRAWLDLQRMVVKACTELGSDFQMIAIAISSEVRALVRDVPEIVNLTLTDDTPAANAETQAWLKSLSEEPEGATPKPVAPGVQLDGDTGRRFVDAYPLAVQALRSGQEAKAFEIMYAEILRQRSGRGRWERKLQMVQLCMAANKEALMQPMLDDLLGALETHKLDEWEDREKLATALATILKASKKLQGDAKAKQAMFERICRLDPVTALTVG